MLLVKIAKKYKGRTVVNKAFIHKYASKITKTQMFTSSVYEDVKQIQCKTISPNLYPTTSSAEGVQIDSRPADDTAELCDRNVFSRSVTSLVIFLHILW